MKRQLFLRAELRPVSPLAIGNGSNEYSDRDILRDSDGKPFIPGSTLAGVCRHDLKKNALDSNSLFGFIGKVGNEYKEAESRIRFYDAFFTGDWTYNIRDNVHIGADRTAADTAKFDFEIADFYSEVDSGLNGTFDFRISIEEPTEADIHAVRMFLNAFDTGRIRVGHKTSRGFGRMKPENVRSVTVSTVKELLAFDWEKMPAFSWKENVDAPFAYSETWRFESASFVSVADYSTTKVRPDTANHFITSESLKNADGMPVILGTSWAGIFRHHFYRILTESGVKSEAETSAFLDKVFGSTRHVSYIVFDESVIRDSCCMQQTRNAIDRFTGGAGDKKLFTGEYAFGGTLALSVSIRNGLEEDEQKLTKQLISLTVADLADGSLSIGGNGSVGGGILRKAAENK